MFSEPLCSNNDTANAARLLYKQDDSFSIVEGRIRAQPRLKSSTFMDGLKKRVPAKGEPPSLDSV